MAFIYKNKINSINQMNMEIKKILKALEREITNASFLMDVRLVLSELIINAMDHGNNWDKDKYVWVLVKINNREIYMEIKDEGEGIEKNNSLDKFSSSGRGLLIVRSLVDSIVFERSTVRCLMKF